MPDLLRVRFYDGKYTIIQREQGHLEFERHDEPWEAANAEWRHVGMILAAAQEIRLLRDGLKEALDLMQRMLLGARILGGESGTLVDSEMTRLRALLPREER